MADKRYTHAPPPPVDVDLAKVMVVGIGLWAVGLVVTLALLLLDRTDAVPAATCATGLVLGLLGLRWARRHDPRRATR